jgi:ribosome recycling factor
MIEDILTDLRESITKAQEALKRELAKVRTGRASSVMLEGVRVDYYGTITPLTQMASITVLDARMLTVKPWDKSVMKAVEKAIREADLGFNPSIDSDVIRVPVPQLTEERRKDMVKIARKHGEECKVAIRSSRREAMELLDSVKDDGGASEDDVDRGKKKVEEVVSEGTKGVDSIVSHKERDVMEV